MSRQSIEKPPAAPNLGTRARFQCVANGCPVVAGIVYSGDTPDTYQHVCRFHDGKMAVAPLITQRLRQHLGLVRIADFVATREVFDAKGWDQRVAEYCERIGLPELAPDRARRLPHGHIVDEVKSPLVYSARLSSYLAHVCAVEAPTPIATRPTEDRGRRIGELIPELSEVGA